MARNVTGGLAGAATKYPSAAIHKFFYLIAVDAIWPQIELLLGPIIGDFEYRLSGHSLGGAVAHLLARELVQRVGSSRVQLLTFGEPRAYASDGDLTYSPLVHWRYDRSGDLVTSLPPTWGRWAIALADVRHIGRLRGPDPNKVRDWVAGRLDGEMRVREGAPWRHSGRQVWLWRSGAVQLEGEGRPPDAVGIFTDGAHNLAIDHSIHRGYWPFLVANYERSGSPVVDAPAVAIGQRAADEFGDPVWAELTLENYVEPRYLRDLVLGGGEYNITPAEAVRAQQTSIETAGIAVIPGNKEHFLGGLEMANFWEVQLAINTDQYGKTQSLAYGAVSTLAECRAACEHLIKLRAALLGRGVPDQAGEYALPLGRGTPAVEMLKIVDPMTPRFGQVFDVPWSWGIPSGNLTVSDDRHASDPLWNSISITLYGVSGSTRKRSTLTLVGFPDRMVEGGNIRWGYQFPGSSPVSFSARVKAFLEELTSSPRPWGFTGADPTVVPKLVTAWAVEPDGQLLATSEDHGFDTGDHVRITGTSTAAVRRTWQVEFVDANSFRLVGSQFTPITAPTGVGRALLTLRANGTKPVAFYRFQLPPVGVWEQPFGAVNRKRNPGRRVNRISFGRPRRRN